MQGGVRGVLGRSKEGRQGAERTAAAVRKGKKIYKLTCRSEGG